METLIFKGKIFSVVQWHGEIDGKPAIRDLIKHNGGVAISAIKDGKILLVSQTRFGAGRKLLEIPAGTLEPGEKPEECAIRELNEEGKLECESMELISQFWPTPGYCSEVLWIFKASNVFESPNPLDFDEGEDIEMIWMDLQEAWQKVQNLEIMDAKTIIAIQHEILCQRGK